MSSDPDPQSVYTLEGLKRLQILSINLKLLQYGIVWPSGLKEPTFIHYCMTAVHLGIYIYAILGCAAYLLTESRGTNEIVERLSLWLTIFKHMIKLLICLVNRKKILSLIYRVEQNFFIHGPRMSPEDHTFVMSVVAKIRKLAKGFIVLCIATCVLYLVHPIVRYFVDGSTLDGERFAHPFKHKVYFDLSKSPLYEVEWVISVMGAFFVSSCTAGTDTLAAALCLYLTCQFQMLCSSLRESAKHFSLKSERQNHSYKNQDVDNEILEQHLDLSEENGDQSMEQFQKERYCYLIECIQHHQSLLQFLDDLNEVMGPMFFIDFLITTILTGLLEFWLVVSEDKGLEFVKVILHLACVLTFFLFYNYLSSELNSVSEDVYAAAYDSDWYKQDVSYKRAVQMMIMRAQKPVALSAMNFTEYSLPTFASVMQTSYTYLAVMRNVQQTMELSEN